MDRTYWEQSVAPNLISQGNDRCEIRNQVPSGRIRAEVNHPYSRSAISFSNLPTSTLGKNYSPAVIGIISKYIYLKSLKILSKPTRKFVLSTSLAVAVHSIFMPKKWQTMAVVKWREMPPKKRTNIGVHFAVSMRDQKKTFWPRRWRSMANASGDCSADSQRGWDFVVQRQTESKIRSRGRETN